ncbi:olfactory receptor 5H2-like [Mustela lutreola]|uniref:olfactory receptor 5H2-like n=1 Tax=Mustela lutreola TaxID=9666 RepID=UPI002797C038|nr:olfactory receptor 5H2-like [Mustela lutreola]
MIPISLKLPGILCGPAYDLQNVPCALEKQISLFLVFLVIYFLTILGILVLIALKWDDPQLHICIYLFLRSLTLVDAWISPTVSPKMLVNFFAKTKMISLSECMIQFFSFTVSIKVECFLLATMAYDLSVAICKPLHYPVIMSNVLCIRLLVLSLLGSLLHAIIYSSFSFFFKDSIVHHFYYDIIPLLKISCTDPSINYLILFVFAGSIQIFTTLMETLVSYTLVLFIILKKKSLQGIKKKAFLTGGAHLLSVSLYYGALIFMYVCPVSTQSEDQGVKDSLFYTIIIPLLNPIIYSLRNKKVID